MPTSDVTVQVLGRFYELPRPPAALFCVGVGFVLPAVPAALALSVDGGPPEICRVVES